MVSFNNELCKFLSYMLPIFSKVLNHTMMVSTQIFVELNAKIVLQFSLKITIIKLKVDGFFTEIILFKHIIIIKIISQSLKCSVLEVILF